MTHQNFESQFFDIEAEAVACGLFNEAIEAGDDQICITDASNQLSLTAEELTRGFEEMACRGTAKTGFLMGHMATIFVAGWSDKPQQGAMDEARETLRAVREEWREHYAA